jgi:DNA-binding transcriptional MocR family regulator
MFSLYYSTIISAEAHPSPSPFPTGREGKTNGCQLVKAEARRQRLIRIGWVAADRQCIERLAALRRFSEVAPSSLLQAAVERFCRDGAYDRHVAKMHRVYRRRMQAALQELRDHIDPAWATWDAPQGGYLIWLRLNRLPGGDRDPDRLAGLLATHGVRAAAGSWFFSSPQTDSYLRLSISALDEEEIVEGVGRLACALQSLYA